MRREGESLKDFQERMAAERAAMCRAEQDQRNREAREWEASGGPDKAARAILDRMRTPANHRDPQGRMR